MHLFESFSSNASPKPFSNYFDNYNNDYDDDVDGGDNDDDNDDGGGDNDEDEDMKCMCIAQHPGLWERNTVKCRRLTQCTMHNLKTHCIMHNVRHNAQCTM